jgi:hypothetical protein
LILPRRSLAAPEFRREQRASLGAPVGCAGRWRVISGWPCGCLALIDYGPSALSAKDCPIVANKRPFPSRETILSLKREDLPQFSQGASANDAVSSTTPAETERAAILDRGAVKKPSAQRRPFVLAGIARYVAAVAGILTALVLGLDPHGLRHCPPPMNSRRSPQDLPPAAGDVHPAMTLVKRRETHGAG